MKSLILTLALFACSVPLAAQQTINAFFPISAGTPQASRPTFSPVAGTYSSTQTVTISTATPLAVLCYTTDGSTPTESSNLCSGGTTSTYSTPITVSTTQTVNAIATLATYTDSSVGSALYTISAGTPAPVGTPACKNSAGAAIALSYTPYAAGDGLLITWGVNSVTATLSSVSDNGGSSYTIMSGQTGQHGSARSLQLAYTTSLHSGVTTITVTPSASVSTVACVQEFSNVSAVSNLTGASLTSTGTYTSGTTPQCTIANTTDYVFLGGVSSISATSATGSNGTLTSNMYLNGNSLFGWEHYALNAHPYGSINYAGGNMSLACVDVQ